MDYLISLVPTALFFAGLAFVIYLAIQVIMMPIDWYRRTKSRIQDLNDALQEREEQLAQVFSPTVVNDSQCTATGWMHSFTRCYVGFNINDPRSDRALFCRDCGKEIVVSKRAANYLAEGIVIDLQKPETCPPQKSNLDEEDENVA